MRLLLTSFYLAIFSVLSLGLMACSSDSYTTWTCGNESQAKVTMVLKKAQMQFQDQEFSYCGSLGPNSYFDLKCPTQPQDSSKIFTPSTGRFISNGNVFSCNAL